jgi:hypothetical protein
VDGIMIDFEEEPFTIFFLFSNNQFPKMLAFWSLKIVKCVCVCVCVLGFIVQPTFKSKATISPLDDMQVGKVMKVWMMDACEFG